MKQTAVEWLVTKLPLGVKGAILDKIEQAKEMEKQRLEQFYNHGQWAIIEHGHGDTFEDYYIKTFKSE
jgi:hypothetical protein